MKSVDPYRTMQEIAVQMKDMTARADIEDALDRMEYLFEVISPEMQDDADTLIRLLRERLKACDNTGD